MNLLVVGGGAIGSLLAARSAVAGHTVTLLARPATVEAVARDGLRLIEVDGRVLTVPVHAAATPADVWRTGPFDLAVLAVKSYDTAVAAAGLRPGLPASTPLLSVQNGVGNENTLAEVLASPILAAALTTPVEVDAPGEVRVARASHKAALAPWRGDVPLEPVAAWLRAAGFTTQVFADGPALKWSKLLMNIVANAQPAILGMTPDQVFAQPALGDLEVRAWQEALAVLRALQITPVALGGYPLALFGTLVARVPVRVVRPFMARFIVGGRGSKPPSLTYDLQPQPRGRSEVAWLNGAVAAAGRRVGVATPVNSVFTEVLTALVEGRTPWVDWRGQPQRLLTAVAQRT
ncbi:MAG: 2-dehydropantoate 2-reductase [Anaerolineae bacterium]